MSNDPRLVYVLCGEDIGLLGQALSGLLEEIAASDGGLSPVEEHAAASKDEALLLGPVLDACRTPPFLQPRRVVVARDAETLDAAQQRELVSYLEDPLDTSTLILCYAKRAAPAAVNKAIGDRGTIIDTSPGRGNREVTAWVATQVAGGPVRLDRDATALVREHLGEDLSRLDGLLETLASAYGADAHVGVDAVEPYLGAAGGVAPWDLTDAIDKADTNAALEALGRLLGGGERHPLQILATLHRHYQAMLALDGASVTSDTEAAQITHLAAFPAGKALRQARQLGHERIARAITLLATADLDLRGRSGLSEQLVSEVLIARLCQNSRVRQASGRTPASRARAAR
jgi:DNA polymerase III subunit delta